MPGKAERKEAVRQLLELQQSVNNSSPVTEQVVDECYICLLTGQMWRELDRCKRVLLADEFEKAAASLPETPLPQISTAKDQWLANSFLHGAYSNLRKTALSTRRSSTAAPTSTTAGAGASNANENNQNLEDDEPFPLSEPSDILLVSDDESDDTHLTTSLDDVNSISTAVVVKVKERDVDVSDASLVKTGAGCYSVTNLFL
ncbi:hypothetical protein DM01DRAFT_2379 [Hesseltinella vesiculosa]|uniref:Uncharacterized protein n=1 Tax=Hesseltinella vesiculosa TaxID=101127 RepID=A0A1X2GDJ4_9FUNG|nr:hypothetical protein DM01DRAFT_2379 [Hesseltinella vesiculosa]